MAKAKPKKFTATDGKLVLELEVAEEGGYIVRAPFDPQLVTQGDTLEEAFEMAYDLAALLRETRKEAAKPTATAKRKPAAAR